MFRFFRRLREQVLRQGKIGRYLTYAGGEIILVVLGILIALQINNWSAAKANKQAIDSILLNIQKNLAPEIVDATKVLDFYFKKDSLLQLVEADQLTPAHFETMGDFSARYAILGGSGMDMNDVGYNNLILQIDKIPNEYDALYQELNHLYEIEYNYLKEQQEDIRKITDNFIEFLKYNHAWYASISGELPEEAIDYFLNDPLYKNHVNDYAMKADKVWTALIRYKAQAIKVVKMIDQLNIENAGNTASIEQYLLDKKSLLAYTGIYSIPSTEIELEFKSNDIGLISEIPGRGKFQLVPHDHMTFVETSQNVKYTFQEEKGQITGLQLINPQGNVALTLEKKETNN